MPTPTQPLVFFLKLRYFWSESPLGLLLWLVLDNLSHMSKLFATCACYIVTLTIEMVQCMKVDLYCIVYVYTTQAACTLQVEANHFPSQLKQTDYFSEVNVHSATVIPDGY